MPITIQLPEGLLSPDEEQTVAEGLTETILELNGASDNPFIRRNLIVAVTIVPAERLFAGGQRELWANVTLRVPSTSLASAEQRSAFVRRMTDIVVDAARGKLERSRVYINMIHGDGFWGIGGETFTEDDLARASAAALV